MTETRKLRVFLCHSSQDKSIVRELYQRLIGEGWIDPWLDEEKLLPGQDWNMEIENAVEATDAVILCLSKSALSKEGYFQKEIKKVLDISDEKPDGVIFIIPLRLEDCNPPRRLSKWQYVDYYPVKNKDKAFARLLQSLMSRGKSLGIEFKQLIPDTESATVVSGLEQVAVQSPQPAKIQKSEKSTTTPVQQRIANSQSHRLDHHSALVSEQIAQASGAGVKFVIAKLQWAKDDSGYSLHAEPS